MDADGYPDDDELEKVQTWPHDAPGGWSALMDYIKSIWWMPDWGWSQEDVIDDFSKPITRYQISTGGWSGNESVIHAMQSNALFWTFNWMQSRRGGHFIFEIRKPVKEVVPADSVTAR